MSHKDIKFDCPILHSSFFLNLLPSQNLTMNSLNQISPSVEVVVLNQLALLTEATTQESTIEIVDLFLKSTPAKISTLSKAIEENDFLTIEFITHQLKSTCGYLGLQTLQEISTQLESAAICKTESCFGQLKNDLTLWYSQYSTILNHFLNSISETKYL